MPFERKPSLPIAPSSTPFGRVLQNVGWLLTGKSFGALLSLAYLALAARSLPLLKFGQFMLVLSTAQAIGALVSFESWQIVIRYGAQHLKSGNAGALGRLVRFCLALDLGGAVVGCGIAVVAIELLQPRLGWSDQLAGRALIFSAVSLLAVRSTAVGILRLHDRFAVGAIADAVTPLIRFLGAIGAFAAGASITGFLIAWGLAEICTAFAYWLSVHRVAPGLLGRWSYAGETPNVHPGFWRFALATNANATLNAASRQFMVVLVGLFVGPIAAGGYRLAYQLSQSVVRLSDLFARGVFPEIARAHADVQPDGLRALFVQSVRLALGAGLAVCILAPIAGQPILWLIGGSRYVDAYPVLVILSIAAGFELMAVGFEPLLIATGRAGWALRIRLVAVVALALTLFAMLGKYGVIGAAVAALASSVISVMLFARAAYRAMRQS